MKVVFYASSAEDLYRYRLPLARRLRDAGYTVVFAGRGGEYAARVEQDGFAYRRIPNSLAGDGIAGDIAAGLRLGAIYRRERPDIVHHFTLDGLVTGAVAARMSKAGWVVQSVPPLMEKARASRLLRPGPRRLMRFALHRAEVTFHSLDDRQFMLSRGLVRPERTHIVSSIGIDMALYAYRDEPQRTPVAAMIGPLQDREAIDAFAYASRQLRAEDLPARFVLVGTTAAAPAIPRPTLDEWMEDGIIEWWGQRRSLAEVLEKIHVVCALEPDARETPHLVLEAAACGRPVVAIDRAGVRSLVRDDETGRVIPPQKADILAGALEALLRNGDHRRCMGKNIRQLVETEFSAEGVAYQTLAVYERLFERGREI